MRRFRERIASLELTVLDRMTSEISRLAAIFSKLSFVASAICSSNCDVEENQPAMLSKACSLSQLEFRGCEEEKKGIMREHELSEIQMKLADEVLMGPSKFWRAG